MLYDPLTAWALCLRPVDDVDNVLVVYPPEHVRVQCIYGVVGILSPQPHRQTSMERLGKDVSVGRVRLVAEVCLNSQKSVFNLLGRIFCHDGPQHQIRKLAKVHAAVPVRVDYGKRPREGALLEDLAEALARDFERGLARERGLASRSSGGVFGPGRGAKIEATPKGSPGFRDTKTALQTAASGHGQTRASANLPKRANPADPTRGLKGEPEPV
mmetsp:Transcript_16260/g.57793  ORF Transcript_16260/g.57793 Transcript_16260/m.57793 type:complete len:214 (-) Transcript_16260:18-659(-)